MISVCALCIFVLVIKSDTALDSGITFHIPRVYANVKSLFTVWVVVLVHFPGCFQVCTLRYY